jgi:uncharacterized cupredoxin-like copper-binding protein
LIIVKAKFQTGDKIKMKKIQIGDLYFKPGTIQLKAGHRVKVELINKGKLEHEFMVGRGVEEGDESKSHMEMEMPNEHEGENGHHEGTHNPHSEMSKRFEKDFFEGIEVVAQTGNGAEFMKVPGHGTMVRLKPESRATIAFTVPADHKGEWQMGCFVPGHYEANMKGEIIIK